MSKNKTYGSYETWIKAAISLTGKPDLFPHLKIPRMTALYWTKKTYHVEDPVAESLIAALSQVQLEKVDADRQVSEDKALQELLREVFNALGFKLRWKNIDDRATREKILTAISQADVNRSRAQSSK